MWSIIFLLLLSVSRSAFHHGELDGRGRVEILLESLAHPHWIRNENYLHEVHRTVRPYGKVEQ
jgi:hypothetical protein